jgi:hypothetical protein
MTVTDLIKKLRQYEEIGTIASVRIEFGDGSIYDDSPLHVTDHRFGILAWCCPLPFV